MNHNQQENQPGGGGKYRRQDEVRSRTEEQAERERKADPARAAHEREARRAGKEHGTSRKPSTRTEKFGEDMPREQQADVTRQREGSQTHDRYNPARQSEGGPRNNDTRGDLPGQT